MRSPAVAYWVPLLCVGLLASCGYFKAGSSMSRVLKKKVVPLSGESSGKNFEEVNAIYNFLLGQYLGSTEHDYWAVKSYEKVAQMDPRSSHLNLAMAKEYLKQGLVFEATTALGQSLAMDSENREALLLMANLHVGSKNYSEARVILKKLLDKDPINEEALVTWVQFEIEDNNHDIAQKLVSKFLEKKKDSGLAYFYLGRLEQAKNNYETAIKHFKKAMELRSGFVQAAAYLGILQEAIGDTEGSLLTFAYLAEQTDNAAFHRRVGQIYLDQKKTKQALAAFRDYERLDSGDLNNKVKIALLYIDLKEHLKAEKKLREILEISPDSENIRFYLAVVLEQQKKFSEALKEYDQIEKDSKLFSDAVRGMVYVSKQSKKEKRIWESFLDKFNSLSPESVHRESLYEIGMNFLLAEKRYEEAKKFIEKALEEFPESIDVLFSKGTLLEKLGEWNESIQVMEKIIKKDSKHSGALNFVGYLLADKGKKLKKAERYIRRALKNRPNDPYILDSLGWVLFRKGHLAQAEQQLKFALTLKPDESIIAEHIGDVLVKQRKFGEAMEYYDKALELGPESQEDKLSLQRKISEIRTPNKQAYKECQRHESDACRYILFDYREPAAQTN